MNNNNRGRLPRKTCQLLLPPNEISQQRLYCLSTGRLFRTEDSRAKKGTITTPSELSGIIAPSHYAFSGLLFYLSAGFVPKGQALRQKIYGGQNLNSPNLSAAVEHMVPSPFFDQSLLNRS